MSAANADQIAYWNDTAGPKWVANQRRLDRLMAPLTRHLLEGAAVHRGEAVVDVGCGCGELSLRLADAVGVDGRVLAVDVSAPMLEHARTREHATEHAPTACPIVWQRADAAEHAFAPDHDLVASRFGVMFFADRLRAFANLRRALRPGGRFVVLAWRSRGEVEWMQAPTDWLAPLLPQPEPADGAVGPFALADPTATCATLAQAGFRDVACKPIDAPLLIGCDVDDAVAMLADTGPAAALMRDADEPHRRAARALLRAKLHERAGAGAVEMGGACWLYRAEA